MNIFLKYKNVVSLRSSSFLLIISALFLSSCDKNRVFEENKEIPDNLWKVENKIKFEVDVKDTIHPHNFYINVRNSDGFPYRNIFLFITTDFPNGKKAIDTLDCILADENGKWLGDGLGDIFDNQIPFKKRVRFPLTGKYSITIEQGMRVPELPLIMDVGIRIEKAEK